MTNSLTSKNFFLLLLLTGLFTLTVNAQTKCDLTVDKLPNAAELHGFRLGMTTDQVKALVPPIVFGRTDPYGVSKTSINPLFDAKFDQASFADVRTISLNFLDGRLVELWIGYDTAFKWQKFDEFLAGITRSLSLTGTWEAKGRGQRMGCEGLEISASMLAGSPTLRLADTGAEKTLVSRREDAANAEEEAETQPLQFIGNKQSKLFYFSGCPGANEIGEANRVIFKDVQEALKAGYKLAKACQQ
jgi:hypothetical protein